MKSIGSFATTALLLTTLILVLMSSYDVKMVTAKTRNSVVMASVTTKNPSSQRDEDKIKDDDKTVQKKRFWPSFGASGKKKEEVSAVADDEKKEDSTKESQSGPLGLFGRRSKADTKTKKDVLKTDKEKEKGYKKNDKGRRLKPSEKGHGKDSESPNQSKKNKTDENPQIDEDVSPSIDNHKRNVDEKNNGNIEEESTDIDTGSNTTETDSKQKGSSVETKGSNPAYSIVYRPAYTPSPQVIQRPMQGPTGNATPNQQSQIIIAGALVNLVTLLSRLTLIKWMVDKLQTARELKVPEQHFMWECINDKYYKDDLIWKSVRERPPLSLGFSNFRWKKIVRAMGPSKEDQKKKDLCVPGPPSRTVIVIDLDTMGKVDDVLSHFTEKVAFLVSANARNKKFFGSEPEVVLNVQSAGGEVTIFAKAAAQVNRLRMAGYKVTACVDRFAASGGYMIASQATQILAAPFAMVGSIGVILEGLNFYDTLKTFGIKSIVLKAGDRKNPITSYGEVSEKDMKLKLRDLEDSHQDFIDLCRSKRPELDPNVCNGVVVSGDKALESGMIDRILTSDDYIFEKMSDGDLIMKLHLVTPESEQSRFSRVLQILPHIQQKLQAAVTSILGGRFARMDGFQNAKAMNFDANSMDNVVQGVALALMVVGAIRKSEFWKQRRS